jgi:hypothetical protein
MIALASSASGPTLRLFNREGDPLVILESDDEGTGTVNLWRNDGTGRSFSP